MVQDIASTCKVIEETVIKDKKGCSVTRFGLKGMLQKAF